MQGSVMTSAGGRGVGGKRAREAKQVFTGAESAITCLINELCG